MKLKPIIAALSLLTAVALLTTSCSKGTITENPAPVTPIATTGSTNIYYVDTFRIYSTDLSGGNRKLLVDEDLKSQNNYIGTLSVVPGSNKLVYSYTTGGGTPPVIKVANADGSGAKVIKTMPANTFINFVKGIAGDKIYYGFSTNNGTTNTNGFYSINFDGTGDAPIPGVASFAGTREASISNQGKGFVSNGYFVKLVNGVFAEANSYTVLTPAEQTLIVSEICMSADATKIAYLTLPTATSTDKYEVRVKDISTKGTSSTVAYTYTMPTTGAGAIANAFPSITWVDSKILFSYGKFTLPKGAASDYIYNIMIDPATSSTGASWSFTGDGSAKILAN